MVPTLVLGDGTSIGEVLAIWRYLEEIYPDPPLLGMTPKDKALVTMWERRIQLEGFAPVMETVRNGNPGLKGRAIAGPHDYDQIRGVVERGKLRVRDFYADLDAHLADVPFVRASNFPLLTLQAWSLSILRQRQSASQYPRTTKPRGAGTCPFLRVPALLPNSRCAGRRELGAACRRQAQLGRRDKCRG